MHVRFVLGPAGSGKTFRCLAEARQALLASPDGDPLLLVAPKQTTYQLERQLLTDPALPGYTRLEILSFERLADFVLKKLHQAPPEMLDEEGRLMVLRGLLARKRQDLKMFRASARLAGFAQQLSRVLRQLQRNKLTPAALLQLAGQMPEAEALAYKLQDLAAFLGEYLDWLKAHRVQDADCLLGAATQALSESSESNVQRPKPRAQSPNPEPSVANHRLSAAKPTGYGRRTTGYSPLRIDHLWVDGFAEWSVQELDLMMALVPHCRQATLTFCLDHRPAGNISWLSHWSVVRKTFEECESRLQALPGVELEVEVLLRRPNESRFAGNSVLQHLEQYWAEAHPYSLPTSPANPAYRTSSAERPASSIQHPASSIQQTLRLATCLNPDAEVRLAAREILRHVRAGGRYREATVLVRNLEGYHQSIQRIFSRYQIPFFLDRRESVTHHPLAELTRSALRTVAFQWVGDYWFAALKTGLVHAAEDEIDRLENEALARGWKGSIWQQSILVPNDPALSQWLAALLHRIMPPFQRLALAMGTPQNKPTGPQLADALRQFWHALEVEHRLETWAAADVPRPEAHIAISIHATVWQLMNTWLQNIELAFATEALPLREWLPILEAGLANLSVGVIPPALDQVLTGAVDRSRNPDVKLALVLGLNETVFPASPETSGLFTEADLVELENRNVLLNGNARQQLARERYLAYVACTRARQRLVLTCAAQDADGSSLNPSPFLSHVARLFPSLKTETVTQAFDWRQAEHASELIRPLLKVRNQPADQSPLESGAPEVLEHATHHVPPATVWATLAALPSLAHVLDQVRHFHNPQSEESLAPQLAAQLYGPLLRTSVSRLEQFAACPFKFFVHSGLRAEERQLFELDIKEQGSFQHYVLAYFHEELRNENQRWRDITPQEARQRIARIANGLLASYRDGLLQASDESRFTARVLTESLQDFVETLVGWMRQQYQFDPVAVELPFGEQGGAPAWEIPLSNEHRLALRGRIDRIDLCRGPAGDAALCVVVDYKSSQKQLDPVLMQHGVQLQLPAYLAVLRHWPNPGESFGAAHLVPAGVFYVSLRGKYDREAHRRDALADTDEARRRAYRHSGRFDARALPQLDARPGARQGDQFNYRLTNDGNLYKTSREALPTAEFAAMLDLVETNLKQMGRDIFSGLAKVSPYRKGAATACDQCGYHAICRIDPWTNSFRLLRKPQEQE